MHAYYARQQACVRVCAAERRRARAAFFFFTSLMRRDISALLAMRYAFILSF